MSGVGRKNVLPLRGLSEGRAGGAAVMLHEVPARGADGGFGLRAEPARCPVLLVGDQPIVLAGLRALLAREQALRVAGDILGGAAALQAAAAGSGIVVFATGAWTAACDGAMAAMRARHSSARVVLLLGDGDPVQMRHFLARGGHAALAMSADVATVLGTIRAARPTLAADWNTRKVVLSERESEVLRRKATGHSNKAIAADLRISVKTVETYYTRGVEKLGLRDRVQVMSYAAEQGWIGGE